MSPAASSGRNEWCDVPDLFDARSAPPWARGRRSAPSLPTSKFGLKRELASALLTRDGTDSSDNPGATFHAGGNFNFFRPISFLAFGRDGRGIDRRRHTGGQHYAMKGGDGFNGRLEIPWTVALRDQ